MELKIYSFDEAWKASQKTIDDGECTKSRRLLLGNGFSRSFFGDKFSYQTLFSVIESEKKNKRVKKLFDYFGTSNFEAVLTVLKNTKFLFEVYGIVNKEPLVDYERIRDALAEAIVKVHPPKTTAIPTKNKIACLSFLQKFDDDIFTVNYDLLLYWVTVQDDTFGDYFFREEDTPPEYCEFVHDGAKSAKHIHFLHGALHLFQKDGRTIKKVWGNVAPLVSQIKDEMEKGHYPLVVAEGDSESKLSRIKSVPYLEHAFAKLQNFKGQIFTFGFSLSEQDNHIVDALVNNDNVRCVWIGIRGDFSQEENKRLMGLANDIQERRNKKLLGKQRRRRKNKFGNLEVKFYNAGSVDLWGNRE